MARLSGQSPFTARPLEGAGGGAERAGRRGLIDCSHGKTSSVTAGDRGGGCSIPLPVSPTPRGRFPMDTVSGDLAVSSRSHLTLLKDPLSAHGTAIRCYRPILPAPCGGGGRRPRSGREVGVIDCSHGKTSSVARRDRAILPRYSPPDLRLTRATLQPPGPRRPPLRSAAYARRYRARGLL